MDVARVFARIKHRLMRRRFPLRWLSRGPYWYLVREQLLEDVIPEEGWISWEQARDIMAVMRLMDAARTGALYGDTFAGQPWQARLWADDTLHIAVAHGVLALVDRRRTKLPKRQAAESPPAAADGLSEAAIRLFSL
jgi:hypothetical protein